MIMVYVTPFRESDKECTAESAPSGFDSLDQVAGMLGDSHRVRTGALIIYGSGDNSVLYSRAKFCIDRAVNTR